MTNLGTSNMKINHMMECPNLLSRKHWAEAEANGIDPNLKEFVRANTKSISMYKTEEKRFDAYLRRFMYSIVDSHSKSAAVYAMFSTDGCLLALFGGRQALTTAQQAGIKVGTDWSVEKLGPNAISIGLLEGRSMTSAGTENYSILCQKYAFYFVPIMIQNVDPPFEAKKYGGLATIIPVEFKNPDYMVMTSAMVHDLTYNLHSIMRVFKRYEMTGKGVLTIDTSAGKENPLITYSDGTLFEMLGIPSFDAYLQPLSKLIDPLPRNSEFWSIIKESRHVENYELTMSVQGKEVICILTTDFFNQRVLNVIGVNFFITTPQRISGEVSKKMGNSAVRAFENIIGDSPAIKATIRRGRLMADSYSNIMLLGESGVGKDIFAQAIHNASHRSSNPFIAVNCGALPRDLIASELFGYDSGAFTGAKRQGNIGKFELANGGTLFLDEIGEMPLDLQATLLRAVEQKKFTRLGGSKEIEVNVKIISATNANLLEMIEHKCFREDLYYRLSTIQLHIPPLRERGMDVILLSEHFIRTVSARIGRKDIMRLSESAKAKLLTLPWRGNVRELQNLIECIVELYPVPVIEAEHLQENLRPQSFIHMEPTLSSPSLRKRGKRIDLSEEEIRDALVKCKGNRSAAANYLGISRRSIYRYIEEYGI